jgi:hypothetical protein
MRRSLCLAVGVALASVAFAAPASANHSWNGYHWARTANPFTIKLGDNMTSQWKTYLNQASSDWSKSTNGNPVRTTVVAGSTTPKQCKATLGRVEVCNAAYGNRGWLGVATISVNQGHITQGTTKMNDTYYSPGSKYDTPIWRAAVVCQEVGHTFGLDHQDESGADFHTCMDYASNPDADNTHPNSHDYAELATIYSHLDTTTTVGLSASPSAKPYKITRKDGKRTSRIVETFADGSKKVTFIYWAV